MELLYKPSFIQALNALEHGLQEEALEKIDAFKKPANHKALRVHKLKGKLGVYYSFSVNYKYRIIFEWVGKGKKIAGLLTIGDHDIYN
ncbi:MAG TPA: type II toxin-antitoxin system RelE/ParE family toxin [Candidatus Paceibacterota bacterium]